MFQQFLERYAASLDAEMQRIVDTAADFPDDFKDMLRYPLGWVNADGSPYHQSTGKRIRPVILLLCTEASGGDWRQALPAAAAVELLHNFSLVHDDIQDNSDLRHNRPTVWKVWGAAKAINVGDAMFALSYRAVEQLSTTGIDAPHVLDAWRIYNRTILELTRGQHLDMSFETRDDITVDDYLSMVRGKTAALLAAAAQLGALVGSGDVSCSEKYAAFGLNLGLAFQIRDDILGIWGAPGQTGKSAATDIIARKKSLPVLYGLSHSPTLRALYAHEGELSAQQVTQAVEHLDTVHAREYAQEREQTYYNAAMSALAGANPQGSAADQLMQIVHALFGRSY